MGPDEEPGFESALRRLMEADSRALVIDLAKVTYVSSSHVRRSRDHDVVPATRHLAAVMVEARESGRSITLRVRERSARILRMAGLDKVGNIEVVGED